MARQLVDGKAQRRSEWPARLFAQVRSTAGLYLSVNAGLILDHSISYISYRFRMGIAGFCPVLSSRVSE